MSKRGTKRSKQRRPEMTLGRALLLSLAVPGILALLAFWPERAWKPPARPALEAPIVLDELVSHAPPPSDAIPGMPPETR